MGLAILFCLGALALGVTTALLTARNQERAARLDELQRECDHMTLENERVRFELAHDERALIARFLDSTLPPVEVSR